MKVQLNDGLGQMGSVLKAMKIQCKKPTVIYHTWIPWDKTEDTQRRCCWDFIRFVENNQNKRIVFISTSTQIPSPYLKYKRQAERFLVDNHRDYKILQFPQIVGKGICSKFKDGTAKPYGTMEVLSMEKAVKIIKLEFARDYPKSLCCFGTRIPAELVYKLIKFGGN